MEVNKRSFLIDSTILVKLMLSEMFILMTNQYHNKFVEKIYD